MGRSRLAIALRCWLSLTSPGQAWRALTERAGPPGTKRSRGPTTCGRNPVRAKSDPTSNGKLLIQGWTHDRPEDIFRQGNLEGRAWPR
jgi:hypothetical protein